MKDKEMAWRDEWVQMVSHIPLQLELLQAFLFVFREDVAITD